MNELHRIIDETEPQWGDISEGRAGQPAALQKIIDGYADHLKHHLV